MAEPDTVSTLGVLLRAARRRLEDAGIGEATLDARLLVEHFTGTTRTDALVSPEHPVSPAQFLALDEALSRRISGMPVHRIIGWREFYGLKLHLSKETLEPRPDTEALVELVLNHARQKELEKTDCRILDLGTGTGAIALALLSVLPKALAVGADLSADALATAAANADMNGMGERFTPLRSDWFEKIEGKFDLIVSNPPYIGEEEWQGLSVEVREHDPRTALVADQDGLAAYCEIAKSASRHLCEGGLVALEIGYRQKEAVTEIFTSRGYRLLDAARDLAGQDRALIFALA